MVLLRFEHIFELNEDSKLSKPITFNLKDRFRSFDILSMRETMLAANRWLDETSRLKFKTKTSENTENQKTTKRSTRIDDNLSISLKPMEIRTFVANVQWKK